MKSSLLVLAFPLALLSANSAFAVDMCIVAGNMGPHGGQHDRRLRRSIGAGLHV